MMKSIACSKCGQVDDLDTVNPLGIHLDIWNCRCGSTRAVAVQEAPMHMRRSASALILIIALIMAVPAIAEPLKDAKKAYDRRDYKTAVLLYEPLANKGDPEAQYALGYMYRTGKGVRKDHVKAYMWFNIAISQLSALDDVRRKLVESNRNLVAVQMTPDQIAEAQKWAGEWKPMKEEPKQIPEEMRTAR